MDYHYESLDEKRFQKLCQVLIVTNYPNAQCLPVGQPDGGRDAIAKFTNSDSDEFTVFQVKFSKNPETTTGREAVEKLIKSETVKVKSLISRGLKQYILVTNVRGTSHLDVGSIDKMNETLTSEFGITSQVWWRDDLDRRLEANSEIKLSYPEILKASDSCPLLFQQSSIKKQVIQAINSYIAVQCDKEQDVKFRQVDLQHKLMDLFVDLPLGSRLSQIDRIAHQRNHLSESTEFDAYIARLESGSKSEFDRELGFNQVITAGEFFFRMPPREGVSLFVVEGAPGQGKSTVTQFICQVNRLRLLREYSDLARLNDEYKYGIVRAPFRLDLRDFATWISGNDPFVSAVETEPSDSNLRSLEKFLVRQIEVLSGGSKISVIELNQFFADSHSMIVLDGFDEVADIDIRKRIVEEINDTATRLGNIAKSMLIIVTSRPAAFANSPGFSEDVWIHLELKDMHIDNINAYKDNWIEIQNLDDEEGAQISSILVEKLEQSHLGELARNPMQLAILLHLIYVHGAALPEKRTMLYDEYIKLFFNREAEKSRVVREHREWLMLIHGRLAWILHAQAEDGSGSGSISKSDLLSEVKCYLETEGHGYEQAAKLSEELFEGSIERVGALVSRQEGLFEFEVQPIREYFVAHHLYKTAPYSPSGKPVKGTRYDRFEALVRNFYWTNVTRFFCGFYDKGELDSLVSGIISLDNEEGYNLIKQPRHLAMMLLSDQVFTQAPRAMNELVAFIVKDPDFRRFICVELPFGERIIESPVEVVREAIFNACCEKLANEKRQSHRRILRETIAQFADIDKRKSMWEARCQLELPIDKLFDEAVELGIEQLFNPNQISQVAKNDMNCHLRWLARTQHYELLTNNSKLRLGAKRAFFEGNLNFPVRWYFQHRQISTFEVLEALLRPANFAIMLADSRNLSAIQTIIEYDYSPDKSDLLEEIMRSCEYAEIDSLDSFKNYVVDLLKTDANEWQKSFNCWTALVDRGLDEASENYIVMQIAIVATFSNAKAITAKWDEAGFKATKGLVDRLLYARNKYADYAWWHLMLPESNSESVFLYLAILLTWGSPETIASLVSRVSPLVDQLSSHEIRCLWKVVRLNSRLSRARPITIPENWFEDFNTLSPRIALMLLERVDNQEVLCQLARTYVSSYSGDDTEVLVRATEIELQASNQDSIDWDYVMRLSRRAQDLGISAILSAPISFGANLTLDVVIEVLSNNELHHEQIVAFCEQNYRIFVAQNARKVSDVARADSWIA